MSEPQIDKSAYVHSFANVVGAVTVGAGVAIAPGTSIRAEKGSPFLIGEGTQIQDGVLIHALSSGRVIGDDDREYAIWIGQKVCIAHLALIHGPVYLGDRAFVGFRSTLFNARVGHDCVVMMHALVQDVEIPPGKFVPSGSVITTQQQADRLPDVTESDRALVQVIASATATLSEQLPARKILPARPKTQALTVPQPERDRVETAHETNDETNDRTMVTNMSLSTEIVAQVRSLLAQGYSVGIESANKRRFKTGSWQSGGIFSGNQALAQIESSLQEHAGEYVRLIGIDTQHKRRVLEMVIQRPEDTPGAPSRPTTPHYRASSNGHSSNRSQSGIGSDVVSQVRALLNQGYKVGTEFADRRRFKTSSWLTGPTFDRVRESDVIRQLESILAEHENEYVRLVGIDPAAKRRVAELVVQRPGEASHNGNGASVSSSTVSYSSNGSSARGSVASSYGLSAENVQKIRGLIAQGLKIGTEHADTRRFKTNSWQSCSPIESRRESEVISALEACLAEHQGEYVRVLGIDEKAKRRVAEFVVQRPGNGSTATASSSAAAPSAASTASYSSYASAPASNSARLSAETIAQVRSLLAQGLQVGTEHANKRRFKTNSWNSCAPISSTRESDVIAAIEACIAEHSGEYVRLLGIDTQAKRRVLETIIQRP